MYVRPSIRNLQSAFNKSFTMKEEKFTSCSMRFSQHQHTSSLPQPTHSLFFDMSDASECVNVTSMGVDLAIRFPSISKTVTSLMVGSSCFISSIKLLTSLVSITQSTEFC
jgi:hypothetical protein